MKKHFRFQTASLREGSTDDISTVSFLSGVVFAITGIFLSQVVVFSLSLLLFAISAVLFDFGKPSPDPALMMMSYTFLSIVSFVTAALLFLLASWLLKSKWWRIHFWRLLIKATSVITFTVASAVIVQILFQWHNYIPPY